MMNALIKPNNVSLTTIPWLSKAIDEDEEFFMTCQLNQFDREGFELLPIEQKYYETNGFRLTHEDVFAYESGQGVNGWRAVVSPWFTQTFNHPNLFLDHSFCNVRCGYAGKAFAQLEYFSADRKELRKILQTVPKYGLDFCIDWIDEEGCVELIHIEWDFRTYSSFNRHKSKLEKDIIQTDWIKLAEQVKKTKPEWKNLDSEDQGKFKAKLMKLNTNAFHLLKSI